MRDRFGKFKKGSKERLGIKHTEKTKKYLKEYWKGKRQGEKHPNWKGGKYKHISG